MSALRRAVMCLLGLLLALPVGARTEDGLEATFIDVGKGDCVLVRCGGHSLLIDAGYAGTVGPVMSALRDRGVEKLDAMIVTHYDKDHVGGAAELAALFEPRIVYLPGYEADNRYYYAFMSAIELYDLDARRVTEDVSFTLGGAELAIYASPIAYDAYAGDEGNDNDVSLVVGARFGEDSYLFAGDIESEGIAAWVNAGHGPYDVLKWPHHGKKEPEAEALIASVQPKLCVITDSEADTAAKKIIKCLDKAGVTVLRSAVHGTITISGDGAGQYAVETEYAE